MVASDTMVGIIGAVVLTVALIGVFVYEATTGGGDSEDIPRFDPGVNASGTEAYTAGQAPPQCQPPVLPCAAQNYVIDMTVSGLPSLTGGELKYAAFLKKPSQTLFMQLLSPVGTNYVVDWQVAEDHQDAMAVMVTLETSQAPSAPGIVLFNATVSSSGTIGFTGNVSLAAADAQSLVLYRSGSSTVVDGTLEGIRNYTGFQHRIWLGDESDSGLQWSLVDNVTVDGDGSYRVRSASVPTPDDGQFDRLVISLEKAGSTAMSPVGFPVYQRTLT